MLVEATRQSWRQQFDRWSTPTPEVPLTGDDAYSNFRCLSRRTAIAHHWQPTGEKWVEANLLDLPSILHT